MIFSDFLGDSLEVFMDDFSVFEDDFDSCLTHLTKILEVCVRKRLVLSWEKSLFMVQEGVVLGHLVSGKGLEVDKAKIEVIQNLPLPTTVGDLQSFLGHVGFYRRFIRDFAKVSKPLIVNCYPDRLIARFNPDRPIARFNPDCPIARFNPVRPISLFTPRRHHVGIHVGLLT